MGLYSGRGGTGLNTGEGAYIREEKRFNLQSVKLTFLSFFFSVQSTILVFLTSCKM